MNRKVVVAATAAALAYVYSTGGDELLRQLTQPEVSDPTAPEEEYEEYPEQMPWWQLSLIGLAASVGFDALGMAAKRAYAATQKKVAAKAAEVAAEKAGAKVATEAGEKVGAKVATEAGEKGAAKVAASLSDDVAKTLVKLEIEGVQAATTATTKAATAVADDATKAALQVIGADVGTKAGTEAAETAAEKVATKAGTEVAEKVAAKVGTESLRQSR